MKRIKDTIEGIFVISLCIFIVLLSIISNWFKYTECDYCGKKKWFKSIIMDSNVGWRTICKKCQNK